METDEIRLWVTILQWLITGAIGIYVWLQSRAQAKATEVEMIKHRVILVEEQMRHIPDAHLVHAMHSDMKAVQARLDGIQRSIDPLADALNRMNTYLLNNK